MQCTPCAHRHTNYQTANRPQHTHTQHTTHTNHQPPPPPAGITAGAITHVPSNQDLIHAVGLRVSRSFKSLSHANLVGLGLSRSLSGTSLGAGGGGGGGNGGSSGDGAAGGGRALWGQQSLSRFGRQQGGQEPELDGLPGHGARASRDDSSIGVNSGSLDDGQEGGGGAPAASPTAYAPAATSPVAVPQVTSPPAQQQQQQAGAAFAGGRPPLSPSPVGRIMSHRVRSLSLDDASASALAP
jgi:hypothetical protein